MNVIHFIDYFIDPVYRGPMIGSILMSLSSSLIGVFVFLKKRSLLGESLSHATYPGVVLGIILYASFFSFQSDWISLAVMIGASLTASMSLLLMNFLERRIKINSDTALCFSLSFFFSMGLIIASRLQFESPLLYKKSLIFLYGQVATMTDVHIAIYGVLSLFTMVFILSFFSSMQSVFFDREFSRSIGINVKTIDFLTFFFLILAIVIGISSVGIVLMSGMLIAPAVAARQFSNRLSVIFVLAAGFGVLSAVLGMIVSTELSFYTKLSFPTGPVIIFFAIVLALLSLFFAPKRGLLFRLVRLFLFKVRCVEENILKGIWQYQMKGFDQIKKSHPLSSFFLRCLISHMISSGWIYRTKEKEYFLTKDGEKKAQQIVRLHRLWEVYLADFLGVGAEKVHRSADQIEHIITGDLEMKLAQFLEHPTTDPHQKPIPEKRV